MVITRLGKLLRKTRIDNDELLFDMAKKLNVSSAFLSAVENGKKSAPKEWVTELNKLYGLDMDELQKAIEDSQLIVKFNMAKKTPKDKQLIATFARTFDELDDNTKDQIRRLLMPYDD
jgi:transcriptional regulator with XRE-family HTH domain